MLGWNPRKYIQDNLLTKFLKILWRMIKMSDYTMQGFYDPELDICKRLFGRFNPLYPTKQPRTSFGFPSEVVSHRTAPTSSCASADKDKAASEGFYNVDEICKH